MVAATNGPMLGKLANERMRFRTLKLGPPTFSLAERALAAATSPCSFLATTGRRCSFGSFLVSPGHQALEYDWRESHTTVLTAPANGLKFARIPAITGLINIQVPITWSPTSRTCSIESVSLAYLIHRDRQLREATNRFQTFPACLHPSQYDWPRPTLSER